MNFLKNRKVFDGLIGFGFVAFVVAFALAVTQPDNRAQAVQVGVTTPSATGSWTPVVTAATAGDALTYSVRVAKFARTTTTATVAANITLGASLSGSGNVSITGLPFFSEGTTNMTQSFPIAFQGPALSPSFGLVGLVRPNTKTVLLFKEKDNAVLSALQMSDLAGGDLLHTTFTYLIK
jgi:hypothetical protein